MKYQHVDQCVITVYLFLDYSNEGVTYFQVVSTFSTADPCSPTIQWWSWT